MTEIEQQQIRALDRCRFGHRAFDQRFIRDLSAQIRKKTAHPLSAEQRYTLAKIVYRYRRQLSDRLPAEQLLQTEPAPEDYGITDHPELINDMFTGEPSPPHEVTDYDRT